MPIIVPTSIKISAASRAESRERGSLPSLTVLVLTAPPTAAEIIRESIAKRGKCAAASLVSIEIPLKIAENITSDKIAIPAPKKMCAKV